jgi:hypothetical protein
MILKAYFLSTSAGTVEIMFLMAFNMVLLQMKMKNNRDGVNVVLIMILIKARRYHGLAKLKTISHVTCKGI